MTNQVFRDFRHPKDVHFSLDWRSASSTIVALSIALLALENTWIRNTAAEAAYLKKEEEEERRVTSTSQELIFKHFQMNR